jgi:hypothetical protein
MFPRELENLYRTGATPAALPAPGPAVATAPQPAVRAPQTVQPVIPGTGKKISRLALTVDGQPHQVSVEELG